MQLEQLAWEIEPQPEERERLADLLADDDHIARKIFKKYAHKSRRFSMIAKSLQKKIKGFRPGSDGYNSRAVERMLLDLAGNKAPEPGWSIYRETIARFFEDERPAVHTMMQSVDVVVPEDSSNTDLSHQFLKAACKHSSEYEVNSSDIELLYELWPLDRLDDIEHLLESCPKFDRAKVAESAVYELRDEFTELRRGLSEQIERTVSKRLEDIHLTESLNKAEERLKKHAEGVVDERFKKVSTQIEQSKSSFAEEIRSISSEQRNLGSLVDSLRGAVEEQRGEMDGLTERIEDLHLNAARQAEPGHTHEGHPIRSPWQRTLEKASALGEVDEDDFITAYVSRCESNRLEHTEDVLRAAHCLLKSSPVVCSADSLLIDAWIETLGWHPFEITVVALPTWSRPDEWFDEQHYLASDSNEPRVVRILDYDVGLVEGYLNPPLRLWSEYEYASDSSKLYLIASSVGHVYGASRAPIVYLDPLIHSEVMIKRSLPRDVTVPTEGVARACFETWISSLTSLRSQLVDQPAHESFDSLRRSLGECGVAPTRSCLESMKQVCSSLDSHGFDSSTTTTLALKVLVLPWVWSNFGEAKASELQAHVGSA